ncbi:DUF7278 family profilin-like fold-containing protein [Enterococcus wangshanyuanii]|uniref:DUF7278 domain-containing protein n=1 Tax=Enterococcus wangshanyuanii TaxID=2005703 RepID=A0ABQ1NYU0_9ENTE|nr:hypothetical protein [Enterococcus wangshanyuanii]GGC85738.1 hypothetical protein GCM10011573_14250 [Enterococcus wangshanyuanii]
MELFEQIEWAQWKKLTDTEKTACLQQLLMYFIPPKVDITMIELVDFELYGIKCRTFEIELDGELFVFIPKNSKAILGWDLGAEGLRPHELLNFDVTSLEQTQFKTTLTNEAIDSNAQWLEPEELYDLHTLEGISTYINDHTTSLRKAEVPAMFVQKYALPAGTEFLGIIDTITGAFEGEVEAFASCEKKICEAIFPKLTAVESLTWSFPQTVLEENQFYLEFVPDAECYFVYDHKAYTHSQLRTAIQQQGFDLLTEDQWEFAVGAGTRRLFRWGNELLLQNNESGRKIKEKMNGSNMFGLVVDTQRNRYELTQDPAVSKLSVQSNGSHLIEQMLPLSTYYCSEHLVQPDQELDPEKYLYRKSIIVDL